ncbi:MAG: glycoside hydrolase family 88 protein [Planctomycetes bacterium]|nr:glycoside hydrolase family 88 protein [Planctomycetota bacterium]
MRTPPLSVAMADTVLSRYADLPPAWSHEYGALFLGLLAVWRRTGEARYFDYLRRHIDAVVDAEGNIADYQPEKYRLDDLVSGRLLLPLLDATGDERYRRAAAHLRRQLDRHPRTDDGGFWHNGGLEGQMLLDGIYMGAPFYAEYALRFEDASALDDAVRQPLLVVAHSRDAASGLYYHGWDEVRTQPWADPASGCSPSFWGRATGWYAMALVDLLSIVPRSHPRWPELLAAYRDLMRALVAVQDPESGLWWHVLDQGDRQGNYLEASASFMILYALARGVEGGFLDQAGPERAAVDRAWTGATARLLREDDHGLTVRQVCKTAGLGGKPERDGSFAYYCSEPVVENDYKGIAGVLLAASVCDYGLPNNAK